MKNKTKILKNYLNTSIFNQSLLEQQKNLISYYNSVNKENNIIKKDSYYINKNKIEEKIDKKEGDEFLIPMSANIFSIRLNQTKPNLIKLSQSKWPNVKICKTVLESKGNVKTNIIITNKLFYF